MRTEPRLLLVLLIAIAAPAAAQPRPDHPRTVQAYALQRVRTGDTLRFRMQGTLIEVPFVRVEGDSARLRDARGEYDLPLGALDSIWARGPRSRASSLVGGAASGFLVGGLAFAGAAALGGCKGLDCAGAAFLGTLLGMAGGMGVGAAVSHASEGWQLIVPLQRPADRVFQPERAEGAGLTLALTIEPIMMGAGDSLRAVGTWTNTTSDTLELLESACPLRLRAALPGGREAWWPDECARGLSVTRLAPGTLRREMWVHPDLNAGTYGLELVAVVLAPGRPDPLAMAGSTRVVARAGFRLE